MLQNGSFLVRNSDRAGKDKPYVITILHSRDIYHVPVRKRPNDSYYAVGEEKAEELVNRSLPFVFCRNKFLSVLLSWRKLVLVLEDILDIPIHKSLSLSSDQKVLKNYQGLRITQTVRYQYMYDHVKSV